MLSSYDMDVVIELSEAVISEGRIEDLMNNTISNETILQCFYCYTNWDPQKDK